MPPSETSKYLSFECKLTLSRCSGNMCGRCCPQIYVVPKYMCKPKLASATTNHIVLARNSKPKVAMPTSGCLPGGTQGEAQTHGSPTLLLLVKQHKRKSNTSKLSLGANYTSAGYRGTGDYAHTDLLDVSRAPCENPTVLTMNMAAQHEGQRWWCDH